MYERTNASVKPRLLGIEELMAYTSLGRGSALKLGQKIGCTVRIDKRVLYDTRKAAGRRFLHVAWQMRC